MSQRKRHVEFSKPDEPSFLKKLKGQMGIKQDLVTIESKKEKLMKKDLDYRDEEPVYVLQDDSGVTEKELEDFKEKTKQEKEFEKDNEISEQRIIFRKPNKSDSDQQTSDNFQSTNKQAKQSLSKTDERLKNLRDKCKTKSVKNSSLLSFNDEDEEDED